MNASLLVLVLFLALLAVFFVAGCAWQLNRNHELDDESDER